MQYSYVTYILGFLAKRAIARYQPAIVGITGSVGKTSTKEAVYTVLHRNFYVAKSSSNINNEIGVPCSVLGIEPAGTRDRQATFASRLKFLIGILKSVWLIIGPRRKHFPKMLILELGADRPGDMRYLSEMLKPQTIVVTAVGSLPVHVEYYSGPEAVAKEKAQIIKWVGPKGVAILNYDDPIVREMKSVVRGNTVMFGFSDQADLWVSDLAYFLGADHKHIEGLSFKLHKGVSFVPMRVPGLIAPHKLYSIMAATAVGMHFGMNLVEIGDALEHFESPKKRVELMQGINGSMLIDDTYNASPLSTQAALETLHEFGTTLHRLNDARCRRIAILGDMKELGEYAERAHREIGALAPGKCDYLITLGKLGQIIADTARPKMPEGRVSAFQDPHEALQYVTMLVKDGDVILVKGSRAMNMEEIVKALAIIK